MNITISEWLPTPNSTERFLPHPDACRISSVLSSTHFARCCQRLQLTFNRPDADNGRIEANRSNRDYLPLPIVSTIGPAPVNKRSNFSDWGKVNIFVVFRAAGTREFRRFP
jgi:hypothetical protein